MKRSALFWTIAVIITLFSLVYQRVTGPTYAVTGSAQLGGRTIDYRFDRSHGGPTNAPVEVKTGDEAVHGLLFWKRYKTDDPWTQTPMAYGNGILTAELPHQPVAGKLMYRVELSEGDQRVSLPGPDPIIIRFRGEVPIWVVIPHVLAMFGAFLFSARGGLEFFSKEPTFARYTYLTLGFLLVGGFMLGPLMQYFSFDVWWTGWPFGGDMTDNKTVVAFVGWVLAAIALKKSSHPQRWVLGAAIVMLVVYLIPHSILGSELNYKELDQQKNTPQAVQQERVSDEPSITSTQQYSHGLASLRGYGGTRSAGQQAAPCYRE